MDFNNVFATAVVGTVSGIAGFFANTIFRKKELDQKGFELLSASFQVQFKRMDSEIAELKATIKHQQVLLEQTEGRIKQLMEENFKSREEIIDLKSRLSVYDIDKFKKNHP